MDFSKSKLCVFYIENDKAFFCSNNVPTVLQVGLPLDIVNDMEVVNEEKLNTLIQTFIESNKIVPTDIIILLSPAFTFEKELEELPSDQLDKEIQKFLEFVPFENISSKVVKFEKKWKVVATSKELCELFKKAFEKQKFSVVGITPASILKETFAELSKNLDLHVVLDKVDAVKQYSFLTTEEKAEITSAKNKTTLRNQNLMILLGILGFLLTVLLIVIFLNLAPSFQPVSKDFLAP